MAENPNNNPEDKTSVVTSETLKIKLAEAGNSPPALVLLMGPGKLVGKQWAIETTNMVIGRSPESQIFVDDKSVSRRHARIILEGSNVYIYEEGSANGTEIDGQKIEAQKQILLVNNQQVKTGNVIFKYLEKGNIEAVTNRVMSDLTQIDPLTEIFNKGALESQGKELFKRAKAAELPLTVIVFDLDNFKMVNDTHGHAAGDFVLKELSAVVKERLIRREDVFGRFGGEEFCLILFGGDLRRGVDVANRVRSTIEKHEFKVKEAVIPVTISAGVATLELSMDSWEELFERADQASYLSKKGGKNRVSTI